MFSMQVFSPQAVPHSAQTYRIFITLLQKCNYLFTLPMMMIMWETLCVYLAYGQGGKKICVQWAMFVCFFFKSYTIESDWQRVQIIFSQQQRNIYSPPPSPIHIHIIFCPMCKEEKIISTHAYKRNRAWRARDYEICVRVCVCVILKMSASENNTLILL